MRLFKTRPYVVFHPESPGVKVLVFRNWVQELIYPKDFASSVEDWYYDNLHVGINRTGTDSNEAFKTNGNQYLYEEVIWLSDCCAE